MVDLVGVTLGAVALLFPIYDACDRLYHGYQLTRSFGDDFAIVQLELEMQYCRLDVTARRRVIDLENPIDVNDPEHATTKTVIKALTTIRLQFELANKLMEKYIKKEDQIASTAINAAENSSATSTTGDEKSNATTTKPKKTLFKRTLEKAGRPFKKKDSGPGVQNDIAGAAAPSNATLTLTPPRAGQELLNSRAVVDVYETESLAARDQSRETSFFRKVVWAKADMDHFHQIIKILKHSNKFLEDILACKPTQDASRMINTADSLGTEQTWQESARLIQKVLLRLHSSLRTMNRASERHGVWKLSIQLATDFAENERGATNALYGSPKLREGAIYFFLQRHMDMPSDCTSFFVVETMARKPSEETNAHPIRLPGEACWELDQPTALADSPQVGAYRDWGVVYTESDSTDIHRLYHAQAQVSQLFGTLPDLLKDENREKFSRRQRVELAYLIAISYVYFGQVTLMCSDIAPSSFCYYATPEEEGNLWTKENPLIMRPYLSIGFGQPPPLTVLGRSTGVSNSHSTIIKGLGLLFFQVGACLQMIYPSNSIGLSTAQRFASFNLHMLDSKMSGAYAELTHACLQYPLTAAPNDSRSASTFLEWVVSQLQIIQGSAY